MKLSENPISCLDFDGGINLPFVWRDEAVPFLANMEVPPAEGHQQHHLSSSLFQTQSAFSVQFGSLQR